MELKGRPVRFVEALADGPGRFAGLGDEAGDFITFLRVVGVGGLEGCLLYTSRCV